MDTPDSPPVPSSTNPHAPRANATPQGPPACFLCRFNHTPDARLITTYMGENIASSSPEFMAAEMSRMLSARHPDEDGTDTATCLDHLKRHTLNPTIRLALSLRALLQLSDRMEMSMERLGDDVEIKFIDMYLKVQNQVHIFYKTPDAKKLFLGDSTGNA